MVVNERRFFGKKSSLVFEIKTPKKASEKESKNRMIFYKNIVAYFTVGLV
jgi:hypothetical protein